MELFAFLLLWKNIKHLALSVKTKSSFRTRNIFCKLKRCSPKLCRAPSLKKICIEDIFGQWYLIFCEWKFILNSLKTIANRIFKKLLVATRPQNTAHWIGYFYSKFSFWKFYSTNHGNQNSYSLERYRGKIDEPNICTCSVCVETIWLCVMVSLKWCHSHNYLKNQG